MLSMIRKSKIIRLSFLLTLLMFVCCLLIKQVQRHIENAYAVTYSLGNGNGLTFYLPKYYDLPPIQQESVRVHEERHLEQGSCALWRHSELEVDAYEYQIKKIDEKIAQLSSVRGHKNEILLLRDFRMSMRHFMRYYQGLESYEEAAK